MSADGSAPAAPAKPAPPRPGSTGPRAVPEVVRPITRASLATDLYHRFLTATWPRLFASIMAIYLGVNALFALGYLACGDGIENVHGYRDAFFFSVQTMSTIGYGKMVPQSAAANALVTCEALCGLIGFAMISGLMFAKFARPTARVMFSRVAVVAPRDGVPTLMFRMANERANQVAEATLHVVLLRSEVTAEGERVRRFHDLPLVHPNTAVFFLTWTAAHKIVPGSPLYGETAESLAASDADIIVSFTGHDETFSQTIHARYTYRAADVVWGERLVDVFELLPSGRRRIDLTKFHDTTPVSAAEEGAPGGGAKNSAA